MVNFDRFPSWDMIPGFQAAVRFRERAAAIDRVSEKLMSHRVQDAT